MLPWSETGTHSAQPVFAQTRKPMLVAARRWPFGLRSHVTMRDARIRFVLSALFICLFAYPSVARAGAPAMTIAGQFGVSSTGAANYSIPIVTPPGTAGMVPSLALDYSSQGSDGIVGWQWSLDGLASISRCSRTVTQDGTHGGVNYDSNDRFCLDGQRLILISGTYGADGSEYRTEIESFTKILAHGTAGSGPAWFEVHARTGQTLELGNTTDSRALAVGTSTARLWALDKIIDTKGNYLAVTYTNDTTNGQIYPTRIDYTGNAGASLSTYNSVRFTYSTSRVDVTPTYQAGSLIQTTVLLTDIKTYAGSSVVYDYQLAYRAGTSTTHSRLTSVTLCDTGGTNCLAPTTFGWQGGTGLPTMSTTANSLAQGQTLLSGDFNGDGLTDAMLPLITCPTGGVIYSGSAGGTFSSANMSATYNWYPTHNNTPSTYNAQACFTTGGTSIQVGDYNGDGLTEVQIKQKYWFYNSGDGAWEFNYYTNILQNNGSGTLAQVGSDNVLPVTTALGDFNGDGRTDLYATNNSTTTGNAWFSNGDGTFTMDGGESGLGIGTIIIPGDFDGDGCSDVLAQNASNKIVYFCNPAVASVSVTNWTSYTVVTGDFNGDGKTDVLVANSSGATLYLSTGTGLSSGYNIPSSSSWYTYKIIAGDWNGDGKTDIALLSQTSGTAHLIFLSTGTGFSQVTTLSNSDTANSAVVADWNNDGAADFWLQRASGDAEVTFAYVPELMTNVSNGIGATTTISYDRINKNGSFYTKGSATYPQIAIDAPIYAVSQVSSTNGVGGNYVHNYAYAGAFGNAGAYLYSRAGGGALTYAYAGIRSGAPGGALFGFTQIAVTDAQTGIVRTTNYRSDFPYVGEISSDVSTLSGVTLSSVANTWASTNLGATRNFVYLSESVVSGNDIDGSSLPTTTTDYTFDSYGNPTVIAASVSGGSSRTTTNTFTNDTTHWILGELTGATVNSIVGSSNLTRTMAYTHDSTSGQVTQAVIEPSYSNLKVQTDYTYDSFGNRTGVTVSGSGITTRSTSAGYDSQGEFQTSATNALSQSESFAYDARFGTPTSHTDINSQMTAWTYDTFGRMTLETRPDGTKTATSYAYCSGVNGGSFSCPTYGSDVFQSTPEASSGTQNGPSTIGYFDSLSRSIASDVQGFDGSTIRTTTSYDANERVYQTSRPYFLSGGTAKLTTYTHDALGRVTQASMPDSSVTTYAFHGLSRSVTNNLSQTTTAVSNAQGLIATATDAASHSTTYVYDAFGNLTSVTDPSGNVIANTFDLRGRKTASSDPDMGSWSYAYDVLSELNSQTDAKSQTTTLTYDLLGRVTERSESGMVSDWVYDGATHGVGRVQKTCTSASSNPSCTSATTTKTFTYDSTGRPSSTTINVDSTNYVYSTAYNATNGGIDTVTYPSGFVLKDVYTAYGYLCRLADTAGTPTCSSAGGSNVYWTTTARDAELHLTQSTAGNGVATTNSFDANTGLLTTVSAGSSGAVAAFDYTYDTIGNLTARDDTNSVVYEKYCYDSLNRLTNSATRGSAVSACTSSGSGIITKTLAYDALGNITSKSDVGTYTYPSSGSALPHAVSSITGTVNGVTNPTYTYDANGNMTAGAGRTVTYTAFNMAASIVQGSIADCLSYDSDHARIKMEVRATSCSGTLSATTTYLNDPASGAMSEKFVSGGVTTWHDFLTIDGHIIAQSGVTASSGTPVNWNAFNWGSGSFTGLVTSWSYFTLDSLGSIAVITDGSGSVTQRLSYDAWGRRRNSDGTDNTACSITSATTRGYTGHEMLDSLCEINANARIYDPTIARFISADPFVTTPFGTQGFNRYSYVNNGPLSATDPSGLIEQPSKLIHFNDPTTYYNPSLSEDWHCYGDCRSGPSTAQSMTSSPSGNSNSGPDASAGGLGIGNPSSPSATGGSTVGSVTVACDGMAGDCPGDVRSPSGIRPAFEDTTGILASTAVATFGTELLVQTAAAVAEALPILLLTTSPAGTTNDESRVTLYRAVDPTELHYLETYGNYGSNPDKNGKYFALTPAGVQNFTAMNQNAQRNLTITVTDVPRETFDSGYRFNDPGAAGPAVHFSEPQLPTVYSTMSPPQIIHRRP